MPTLLILHHDPAHGPLDRAAARLATGLSQKAATTLLLPGGPLRAAATGEIGPKVAVEAGRGGRRPLLSALPGLVQRLKADAPDHLLATGIATGWLAAAANIAAGRRSRLTLKLDRPLAKRGALAERLQASVFGEAARILVPSDADRRALAARFPVAAGKAQVAAEPIVPATGRVPPPPRHKGDVRRLLASAPIDRDDGFGLILDALPLVAADVRLTILGDGPGRAGLSNRVAALGLAERVEFASGDIQPQLRDADLYLLARAEEAMPVHLIEALAADRGVVTVDGFAAARDLLDGAPGCAVLRRAEPQLMAQAIDAALRSGPRPSLRPIAERHAVPAAIQAHGWAIGLI